MKRLVLMRMKRIFCKHSYHKISMLTMRHFSGKEVVFSEEFWCVKCGKRIYINRNEESQLNKREEIYEEVC